MAKTLSILGSHPNPTLRPKFSDGTDEGDRTLVGRNVTFNLLGEERQRTKDH
jgi:hypothetical protein